MVSTHNKRVPSFRAAGRNDGSESAGGSMVHSIRHTRRVANNSAAQTNEGSGTAGDASQRTIAVEAPPIEPPKKRGGRQGPEQNLNNLHMVLKWLLNQVVTSECISCLILCWLLIFGASNLVAAHDSILGSAVSQYFLLCMFSHLI